MLLKGVKMLFLRRKMRFTCANIPFTGVNIRFSRVETGFSREARITSVISGYATASVGF